MHSLKRDLAELELEYLTMNNKKKKKFHTVGKAAFSMSKPKENDNELSKERYRDRIGEQDGKRSIKETLSLFKDKLFDKVKRNMRET